jgi:NADPH:quinone reductase-like Zn-dependent oxidoreductase
VTLLARQSDGGADSEMLAMRLHRYGEAERLNCDRVARPRPGRGEVLVRVHAAGVNPVDWKTRQGRGMASRLSFKTPLILGWDVAGVVEETSVRERASRDPEPRPGTHVCGLIRFPEEGGTYAQYVAAPSEQLAVVPAELDFFQAAAVPLAALTAWQALVEAAALASGQRVLIHAGAGGVGHFAVQLARWRGAHVIATTSRRKQDFVRSLGAHEVIDYDAVDFETAVDRVDVVLDSIGGDVQRRSAAMLRPSGVLVTILALEDDVPDRAAERGARTLRILVRPDGKQLAEICRLIDSRAIWPHVHSVLPLADAEQAHAMIAAGEVTGKIVLEIPQ